MKTKKNQNSYSKQCHCWHEESANTVFREKNLNLSSQSFTTSKQSKLVRRRQSMNKTVQNSNSNQRSIIDCKRDKTQGSEEAYLHVTPIFEELNSLFLKSSHE